MKNTAYEQILYNVKNEILTITLNRPERLNAWTRDVMLRANVWTPSTRLTRMTKSARLSLRGAGRATAGVDLTVSYENPDENAGFNAARDRDLGEPDCAADLQLHEAGYRRDQRPRCGGITMTLPMDIRIAADTATFGFVFARRGIVPEACSSWFSPALSASARRWSGPIPDGFFRRRSPGRRSYSQYPSRGEKLLEAAGTIAREIADMTSAVSISLTRQMMWRMLGSNHPMGAHKIDSRAVYYAELDGRQRGEGGLFGKRARTIHGNRQYRYAEFYPWWNDEPFE